jgi:DNA polymerase-3 subunit alpha
LLASLDRIVAASTSHFRAAEAGQMSLFGAATGVQAETITLPENVKVERKDMLTWERELIGLYLSDHPLAGHTELLTKAVSHNAFTLNDAAHEERVRIAGMIMTVRPYKTKTDKMMGFVTIEDLQGPIELVIFPRTWDKTRALCEQGKVVVVDGKVDSSGQPIKILVDEIRTEVTFYEAAPARIGNKKTAPVTPTATTSQRVPAKGTAPAPKPVAAAPTPRPAVNAPVDDFIPDPDDGLDGAPPPPEFPPDWENYTSPNRQYGFGVPTAPEPAFFPAQPVERADEEPKPAGTPPEAEASAAPIVEQPAAEQSVPEPEAMSEPAAEIFEPVSAHADLIPEAGLALAAIIESLEIERPALPPVVPPPPMSSPEPDNAPPQLISILMRPCGSPERDRRRIKHIYGILISYPGKDRFSFRIFENGKGYLLDFPNDTTRVCPDMLERLKKLIGEDTWRVEPLVYQ